MLEELKAQTGALYFTDWLAARHAIGPKLVQEAHVRSITWAFGHISRGMAAADGQARPYSQLAAIQVGWLLKDGALACGHAHSRRQRRRREDAEIANLRGEKGGRAISARERVGEPGRKISWLCSPQRQPLNELDVVSDTLPAQSGPAGHMQSWHPLLQHEQTLVTVQRR